MMGEVLERGMLRSGFMSKSKSKSKYKNQFLKETKKNSNPKIGYK
jgi:hypothetical protein